jgi:hypothetical protein
VGPSVPVPRQTKPATINPNTGNKISKAAIIWVATLVTKCASVVDCAQRVHDVAERGRRSHGRAQSRFQVHLLDPPRRQVLEGVASADLLRRQVGAFRRHCRCPVLRALIQLRSPAVFAGLSRTRRLPLRLKASRPLGGANVFSKTKPPEIVACGRFYDFLGSVRTSLMSLISFQVRK